MQVCKLAMTDVKVVPSVYFHGMALNIKIHLLDKLVLRKYVTTSQVHPSSSSILMKDLYHTMNLM